MGKEAAYNYFENPEAKGEKEIAEAKEIADVKSTEKAREDTAYAAIEFGDETLFENAVKALEELEKKSSSELEDDEAIITLYLKTIIDKHFSANTEEEREKIIARALSLYNKAMFEKDDISVEDALKEAIAEIFKTEKAGKYNDRWVVNKDGTVEIPRTDNTDN